MLPIGRMLRTTGKPDRADATNNLSELLARSTSCQGVRRTPAPPERSSSSPENRIRQLRFLPDWRVPAGALARLGKAGLEARPVGELAGPPRNPGEFLAAARKDGRMLVTAKYVGVGTLVFPMLGQDATDPPVLFICPDCDPADEEGLASDLADWRQKKPTKTSTGWEFGWLA